MSFANKVFQNISILKRKQEKIKFMSIKNKQMTYYKILLLRLFLRSMLMPSVHPLVKFK